MLPQHSFSMRSDRSPPTTAKPRNACDECRTRKLKCSGEPTGCSRCKADRVACRYSPRKQMGRPRKKRTEEEVHDQGYEPWTMASTAGGIGASDLAYAGMDAQIPTSSGYGVSGPSAMGSPNLDFGFSNMDLNYMGPSTSQAHIPDLSIPLMGSMPPDFSNLSFPTSPNLPTDNYPWGTTTAAPYTFSSPSHQPSPSLPTPPTATTPQSGLDQSCRCLPHLYKTLQLLPPSINNPNFPLALRPLRRATQMAATLLHCPLCTIDYAGALQNSMGCVTLLNLIVTSYHKLLVHIDSRAKSSNKIKFRFGEMTPNQIGHTGGEDCPMGIEVDLSGSEWRTLARKTVRREVFGDEEDDGGHIPNGQSLIYVLQGLKARQREWHSSRRFAGDVQHQHHHHQHLHEGQHHSRGGSEGGRDNCICVQGLYFEQLIQRVMGLGL